MIRALHFYIVTILIIRVLCITHIIDLHPRKKNEQQQTDSGWKQEPGQNKKYTHRNDTNNIGKQKNQ